MVDLLMFILVLALIGFILYLIITYIPMPDVIKQVIIVIVAIVMILYLIQMISSGGSFPVLKLR